MINPSLPDAATFIDDAERLARRAVIDRAKARLMDARGMTEPEAYRWIQKNAMDGRLPMVVIATRIVEAAPSDGTSPAAIAS